MGRAKRQKTTPANAARRAHAIVNPNAQRHTMTVASIHSSQMTVHVTHSATTKSQPLRPAKPVLMGNGTSSSNIPSTESDSEDLTSINVPEEVGQTQVSSFLVYAPLCLITVSSAQNSYRNIAKCSVLLPRCSSQRKQILRQVVLAAVGNALERCVASTATSKSFYVANAG